MSSTQILSVETDASDGAFKAEITVLRYDGIGMFPPMPDPDDLPADVALALHDWLNRRTGRQALREQQERYTCGTCGSNVMRIVGGREDNQDMTWRVGCDRGHWMTPEPGRVIVVRS